ncbi:chromosome transmission fidelity factor 18 [Holotrichia oblita]|uniref:Chromosome transmission fidelity factor 18 n=1 Tax=Holotrichia oblita TaxID=644536 RepID=A0ACB9SLC6_HOLOL|nr:chromosome transmission fidelity factor 18 [Holotrichia oblita]
MSSVSIENNPLHNSKSSASDKCRKKHRKRSKRRKVSDPTVTNISNLLSASLHLISPKECKSSKNERSQCNTPEGADIVTISDSVSAETSDLENGRITEETDKINVENEEFVDQDLLLASPNENLAKTQSKNAFEFMMESSRKSIGRNSPGKEPDRDIVIVNGDVKNKLLARKFLFEKWATMKGSKKRKVEEKEREVYVKHKLEKRAEIMKKMLSIDDEIIPRRMKARKIVSDSEDSQDVNIAQHVEDAEELDNVTINLTECNENKNSDKNKKKICDKANVNHRKKESSKDKNKKRNSEKVEINNKEDSLNNSKSHTNSKKSNLDSFLGISSTTKSEKRKFVDDDEEEFMSDSNENINEENVIKIKMFSPKVFQKRKRVTTSDNEEKNMFESKCKLKYKTKTHENGKSRSNNNSNDINNQHTSKNILIQDKVAKLRKGHQKRVTRNFKSLVVDIGDDTSNDSVCCVQSDSEITSNQSPRRSLRYTNKSIPTYQVETDSDEFDNNKKEGAKSRKNDLKLAPIFIQKKPKQKIDPLILEARKQFLMSGIPEALKKNMDKQQSCEEIEPNFFPEISHIQQKQEINEGMDYWNLPRMDIKTIDFKILLPDIQPLQEGALNNYSRTEDTASNPYPPEKINHLKSILLEIKKQNPDYPVFKSFRLLKQKADKVQNGDAEIQTIAAKKPRSRKSKRRKSETKIEEQSEKTHTTSAMWTEKYKANTYEDLIGDNTSCDEMSAGNVVIIHGPHGSGKTMTIYALCNELGINVLELNASSKRTGKRLMQELQEATQSHQVRKNDTVDMTTFFKPAKKKKQEKTNSITNSAKKNSKICLLLVEDVDIVFEQDDGFLTALIQLLTTSKRPIILNATDISSPNLQKILSQHQVVKFSPLSPKVMTVWIQILCLIEGCYINKDSLTELLEWNKGDVRKTLLQLQFWIQSGGGNFKNIALNCIEETKTNIEESLLNDDSHLSVDDSHASDSITVPIYSGCVSTFMETSRISLGTIWWNLHNKSKIESKQNRNDIQLKDFYEYFNTFSVIDESRLNCNLIGNDHLSVKYASFKLKDSIELSEVYSEYNCKHDFMEEWSQTLTTNCTKLYTKLGEQILDISLPNSEHQRWRKKQDNCKSKFMEIVPVSCNIDRRAFALDYYPTLRTISRSEEVRFANTQKRKNRFFNYFRTLDFYCSDSVEKTARMIFNKNFTDCEKT